MPNETQPVVGWIAEGVDGELTEKFAGDGVDDPDVEVMDEDDDVGPSAADDAGGR